MRLSSSLDCKFLLFAKIHHNSISIIELNICNNDKTATPSQFLYRNSATVVTGVTNIKTKKAIKNSVMISVGYFR